MAVKRLPVARLSPGKVTRPGMTWAWIREGVRLVGITSQTINTGIRRGENLIVAIIAATPASGACQRPGYAMSLSLCFFQKTKSRISNKEFRRQRLPKLRNSTFLVRYSELSF